MENVEFRAIILIHVNPDIEISVSMKYQNANTAMDYDQFFFLRASANISDNLLHVTVVIFTSVGCLHVTLS